MGNALNIGDAVLTRAQVIHRRRAREIARDALAPNAVQVDATGAFPGAAVDALKRAGLLNLLVPQRLGGAGGDLVGAALVVAALAEECASTAAIYAAHLAALAVVCAAAEEDRHRSLLRGEKLIALAVGEGDAEAPPWHVQAALAGGTLDGRKAGAPAAGHADYYLLAARREPDYPPDRFDLFTIEGGRTGMGADDMPLPAGLRGAATRPLSFARLAVGEKDRLASDGYALMLGYAWPVYHIGLAACSIGIARTGAREAAAKLTGQGADAEATRADMHWRLEEAMAMLLHTARHADAATVLMDEFQNAGLLDEIVRENPDDPFFAQLAALRLGAGAAAVEIAGLAQAMCGNGEAGGRLDRVARDAGAVPGLAPSGVGLRRVLGRNLAGPPFLWT